MKLAILGSTRGTNMLRLITAIQQKQLPASIELVLSDRSDALILQRAKDNELQAFFINPAQRTREDYDQLLTEIIEKLDIELIVLIGWMRILSHPFIARWRNRVINVHPSLLPAFAGGMDKKVHQAVLDAGVSESGCTVHFVTEDVDLGPILIQKKCPVLRGDAVDTLRSRVQNLEGEALIESIQCIINKNRMTKESVL